MYTKDIRCPTCRRWQGRAALFGLSTVELLCRCGTRMISTQDETMILVSAASVSRTFDGRLYVNGTPIM